MDIPPELIDQVDPYASDLIALPGVTGVGIGMFEQDEELQEDQLAVRVLVADVNQVPDGIPTEIAGLTVCVVECPVEPLLVAPDTARYSELKGGCQIQRAPGA